jgi:flagellar biosynthesis GTPase FlhF
MRESSTKQIDAVWILHSANSDRCHLEAIYSNFEAFIGPGMQGMTTVIITKCDEKMKKGDYFQYPNANQFILPEKYNQLDEDDREERFWVKIMK